MNRKLWGMLACVCTLAMMAASAIPARAQDEVKEKPPMYTYVGFWNIPRAQWAEMEKNNAAEQKILDKALADGAIVAYGNDLNIVHTADGMTHDDWWSAMSMAAMLERAGQVLQVRYANFTRAGQRHQAHGRHICQPVLQLAFGYLQGRLHPRGPLQTEAWRLSTRLKRSARRLSSRSWKSSWPTDRLLSTKSTPKRSTPRVPERSGST
jgi:hypothetical protein